MDAAFFRFLAPELLAVLTGARIDSVFNPAPGFWTFPLSLPVGIAPESRHDSRFLLLRVHPRLGGVFLSAAKPANPAQPSAKAMWLRKRLRGRLVTGGRFDWGRRALALELFGGQGGWLLFSFEEDPTVLERLPDGFGRLPDWVFRGQDDLAHREGQGAQGAADLGLLTAGLARGRPEGSSREAESLRGFEPMAWPPASRVLADPASPRSLRAALNRAEAADRQALLDAFLEGRSEGFFVDDDDKPHTSVLPWPASRSSLRYQSALQAAQAQAGPAFFQALAPAGEDLKAAAKRRDRLAANQGKDQARLEGLTRQHLYGETLAANLSRLDTKARLGPTVLEHPEHGAMTVPLAPALTVLENMERFFRKAAKGRRGLAHLERLRLERTGSPSGTGAPRQDAGGRNAEAHGEALPGQGPVGEGVAGVAGRIASSLASPPGSAHGPSVHEVAVITSGLSKESRPSRTSGQAETSGQARTSGQAKASGPSKTSGRAKGSRQDIPLHRFRSVNGFVILRGRNSAANHRLLTQLASPFDYWFHAEGGPGAHVILKRDHPGQEVPEEDLLQAAALAALASWRGMDSKAEVLVAQARDVRTVAGAALGRVSLAQARTLAVTLDPSLEERLRPPA